MSIRDSDWRSLYPFESLLFALDRVQMHFLDEGPRHAEPLLLVHGNPTWSFFWRNLVLAFRDRYRLVAPDHIGCGMSDHPWPYPYTLQQHTENLLRLIDHLDLRQITLAVHDWGGPIGLGAALQRPDRFARLVIFNTGAFPPPFVPLRIRLCRTPGIGRVAVQHWNWFARAALWMATEKPERLTPPVRAGLLAPYDAAHRRAAIWGFVRDIPLTARHPTWGRLAWLEQHVPTLGSLPAMFIWGMKDWCFRPACLERMYRLLPHAEVHRLEDAGHYVVEDAHERIVPLVDDFLARHPLKHVPQWSSADE